MSATSVVAALAGPPMRIVIRDLDTTTAVAILSLVGVIVTTVVTLLVQHRDRGSKVISDMTASQSNLQDQIDKLDNRLVSMYAEDQQIKEQVARQQSKMVSQQEDMDEDARYIRSIAHWLREACEVMNIPDEWTAQHPKPRLPDSIRSRIVTSDGGEKK